MVHSNKNKKKYKKELRNCNIFIEWKVFIFYKVNHLKNIKIFVKVENYKIKISIYLIWYI